jgi:hypothetical protein
LEKKGGKVGSVKAFIFRKGSGQLKVHPSPVILGRGDNLVLVNLTGQAGTATFDTTVDGCSGGKKQETLDPDPTKPTTVTIAGSPPFRYFEYDVVIGGNYAEGGSKPGGIVDP